MLTLMLLWLLAYTEWKFIGDFTASLISVSNQLAMSIVSGVILLYTTFITIFFNSFVLKALSDNKNFLCFTPFLLVSPYLILK